MLDLSKLGLGTWAIGGNAWKYGWGAQSEQDSRATLYAAVKLGFNWIDTAPLYGFGKAEFLIGDLGEQPVAIATKCGFRWDERGKIFPAFEPEDLKQQLAASRLRLKRQVIDLYQLHWPPPSDEELEQVWQNLLRLRDSGGVRLLGVCNLNVAQLERVSRIERPFSLQAPFSLLEREIEKEILPWCLAQGIAVHAYSPLQAGILTDKFSLDWLKQLPDDDWRKKHSPWLKPHQVTRTLRFVESSRKQAQAQGSSVAQLALEWVLQKKGIRAAVVGARSPQQLFDYADLLK